MQTFETLAAFGAAGRIGLAGPIGILLCEDEVEAQSALDHMARQGFRSIVVMAGPALALDPPEAVPVLRVGWSNDRPGATAAAVNAVIDAAPGRWMHFAYNAEYLFYPFCESRSVGEMLAFHAEERRDAMLTYVVDLYGRDLHGDGATAPAAAHFDAAGYFAVARPDPYDPDRRLERQIDIHGGLRWRFEEHVPPDRRRIDRVALFRARKGVRLREDFTFSEPEYNTYACPWHHNVTAAICSFRAAKALARNAGSRDRIDSFMWSRSVPFEWRSRQLMDLGLMEPGQWF